jgi:putative NIF3 family GTP cyclohydrolase 1 type 2
MEAADIHRHFVELGTWVDWSNTTDGFHFGDPETEVTKIAVAWKPYFSSLMRAAELGCDFFLSHESIFRDGGNGDETSAAHSLEGGKLEWLRQSGMVVYRCHDVWDVIPEIGVIDSWARGLGFEGSPVRRDGYYRLEDVSGQTFGELCRDVAAKMRSVGHEGVLAVGDAERSVSRLALGTGAITKLDDMVALGADVCVICDDYFRYVRDGALFQDLDVPYIVVNHGAKEEWGIENLYRHVKEAFEDIPAHFIAQGCPYRIVTGEGE